MSSVTLSVILYAAIHSGQSCEKVFQETAVSANPGSMVPEEKPYLIELATAACQTTNPDIIWQIVQTESNFRFLIIRQNTNGEARVYRGEKARLYLEQLAKDDADLNVDIGAMQLNWEWHREGFRNNPNLMFSPAEQVDYLLNHFGDFIYRRCSERWVGCYHHPNDTASAKRYELTVQRKGVLLATHTINYLQNERKSMSPEQKAELPPILREEIYEVLDRSRNLPLPVREFFSFAHFLQMSPVKVAVRRPGLSS